MSKRSKKPRGERWDWKGPPSPAEQARQSMVPTRVLIADPPWRFGDRLPGPGRGAASHYPCMTASELCRFPLPPLAHDCVLFFWRVATMVSEANAIIRAWGFSPTGGELKWVKLTPASAGCIAVRDPLVTPGQYEQALAGLSPRERAAVEKLLGRMHFGMGRTTRNSDEVCIIARRGKPKIEGASERSVFFAPMPLHPETGKLWHSAKPKRFYDLVERMVPGGPYVELFSRRRRPGWTHYGDQLEGADPAPVRATR